MASYDDLWSKVGDLKTTTVTPQKTQGSDQGSSFDPLWDKVGNLSAMNQVTKTPPEQPSTAEDVGRSALAGTIRGVAALPGLPGDVAALGRYGLEEGKYYGLKAGEATNIADQGSAAAYRQQLEKERAAPDRDLVGGFLPTSEYTTKKAEEYLPAAKYNPTTTAGRFAKTAAEFLPSAVIPVGEASLAARAGTALASGVGSEALGTVASGTPLEPVARIAGAFAGPTAISAATKTISPLVSAFRNPEEAAIKQLAAYGQTEASVGMEGRRTYQQLVNERAKEIMNNVPEEQSIVRAADLFASSPAEIIKNIVNEKNMANPEVRQQAQSVMQGFYDRAAENKNYLAKNIAEVTDPYTTSVVNRYRAAQGLDPISGSLSPDDLRGMAQNIARARNEAFYQPAYQEAQSVWNGKLEGVLNSPQGQKAAWAAVDELNNSMAGQGQATRDWLREVKMPGSNRTTLKLEGGLEGLPLEFWDRFGRNLRQGADSGVTKNLMSRLDQGITDYYGGIADNPYTQAKGMARTGFKEGDAFSAGSDILKDARASLDPAKRDQFLSRFGTLGDEEKALYSAGVSQAIQSRVAQDGGLAYINKFLNNPENAKVLQQAMDWNLPQGAYSNFERVKNSVDVANNINKIEKVNFLNAQPSVQNWFNRHPILTNVGAGGAAVEVYNLLRDFHLINTPLMLASLGGGYALDKLRTITSNRQAVEVLKVLDSRDPEMIARLSEAMQKSPETKKAYQQVADLFNVMDKESQKLYKKAALTYAGGQARAIESKEKLGYMQANGGRVEDHDVPHKFYGGGLSYNNQMMYNNSIMNLLRNFYSQLHNRQMPQNNPMQNAQLQNQQQALPSSQPSFFKPYTSAPAASPTQYTFLPPLNILQRQQAAAAQTANNPVAPPSVAPNPVAAPPVASNPVAPPAGGIFNQGFGDINSAQWGGAPSGYTGPTSGVTGTPSSGWGLNSGGRVIRATGGRIPDADKAFKSAKKYIDSHTKSLLNVHDDEIVHALRIAQGKV